MKKHLKRILTGIAGIVVFSCIVGTIAGMFYVALLAPYVSFPLIILGIAYIIGMSEEDISKREKEAKK